MKTGKANKIFKNLIPLLVLFMIISPVLVSAQTTSQPPLIPDCGVIGANGRITQECGYNDLLKLVNNIINWIIMISFPVAAGVMAWAGFTYMTTGISDQKSAAKKMLQKVFIGFICILAAWLIVNTILDALLADSVRPSVPVEGQRTN